MKRIPVLLLILACACVPALAQETSKTPPSAPPARPDSRALLPVAQQSISGHVTVGESAPDFELTSSASRDVALSSLRGDWVLLYFARDRRQFERFQPLHADLSRLGVVLVGVCNENPQSLRSFARRKGIGFEILGDATGEICALYGLFDHATDSSRTGCVVIDRGGIVRLVLHGDAAADQVAGLTQYTVSGFRPSP